MKKRTDWNWSKHTHKVEIFKNEDGKEIRVDHFQDGNSRYGYLKFVNDSEGLAVYGDFGNWIFCRPFHPSPDGSVSDMYWAEKLSIGSVQDAYKFNSEATAKELEHMIDSGLEDYGYEDDELEKGKEWFRDLLSYTDDELEYTYEAYRGNNPTDIDYEYIPFVKELSIQLRIVFDAFDEICNRLKNKE